MKATWRHGVLVGLAFVLAIALTTSSVVQRVDHVAGTHVGWTYRTNEMTMSSLTYNVKVTARYRYNRHRVEIVWVDCRIRTIIVTGTIDWCGWHTEMRNGQRWVRWGTNFTLKMTFGNRSGWMRRSAGPFGDTGFTEYGLY